MSKYNTKQRKLLLGFLSVHADEEITAKQIAESLNDNKISVSAVYRNLAELESDGKIRRISKSGNRQVFFQYIDDNTCKDCLHLSCEKCGKTFHMNSVGAQKLINTVSQSDEFFVNKANTVLYGVCRACREKAGENIK